MQVIKTIVKYILLHRWNKINKTGIELMLYWYKLRPRNKTTQIIFNTVLRLNGFEKTDAHGQINLWSNYTNDD